MTTEKRIVLTMSEKEAKSLERVLENIWYTTNWNGEKNAYTGDIEISKDDREFAFILKKLIGKEVSSC